VEVVTVVLAALAVLITVLGIFIAVLAVWGYARLSNDARNAAISAARDATSEIVPLVVREEIDRQMGSGGYGEAAAGDTSDAS
jgi:biopolymer transport protein ExbB/TolQ